MATIYYNAQAAGTGSGADWTNACTTLAAAIALLAADGDVIKVHYTSQEELTVSATFTFTYSCAVISVNKDSSDAYTPMGTSGWVGKSSTTAYGITLSAAAGKLICFAGMTFLNTGSTTQHISVGSTTDSSYFFEDCYLWLGTTSTTARIRLGADSSTGTAQQVSLKNCTFRFAATAQGFSLCGAVVIEGGSISSSGSAPATIFQQGAPREGVSLHVSNADLSYLGSGTLIGDCAYTPLKAVFWGCKLGSGFTVLDTQTAGPGGAEATLYDCASGDTHYALKHANALGSCEASTSIYASDAPTYDGTNKFSWRIDTSALATFYTPYVTPWISTYHDGTSAITLSLEGLISSSSDTDASTQLQDDEVWGEFSVKTTTGSTLASISNDRMALLGTAANQTSAKGAGDWTGEQTYFSTFKCASASVTPAEIGELCARLCVGFDTSTRGSIYLDPQIRTA